MTIRIADICYYPLKSAQAVHAERAEVIQTGIRNDRQAVLVHADGDDKGKIITQRTEWKDSVTGEDKNSRKLALAKSYIDESSRLFHFTLPDGRTTCVSLDMGANRKVSELDLINVWDNAVRGIDAGDNVACMFSEYLEIPCRMMLYPGQSPRSISPRHAQYSKEGDVVSFADKFPLLITSQSSLEEVNRVSTLIPGTQPYTMDKYRPNIVLEGAKPWAEDLIHIIQVGDMELELCRPADRCMVTTINQTTADIDDPMSLARLSALRYGKGGGVAGAIFGALARPNTLGTLSVGDEVKVVSWREKPHESMEKTKMRVQAGIIEFGSPPPSPN